MTEKLEEIKRDALISQGCCIANRRIIMRHREGAPPVIASDILNIANAKSNLEHLYDVLLEHVRSAEEMQDNVTFRAAIEEEVPNEVH